MRDCYAKSEGALSCLTCHDPHRKIGMEDRAAHYRAACQSCHGEDACARGHGEGRDTSDCTSCHMPERRTEDVVHVTMTDHRIQRDPGGADLLAVRVEQVPVATDVVPLFPEQAPTGELWQIYRAATTVRVYPLPAAVDRLALGLSRLDLPEPAPWLDLAEGLLDLDRYLEARRVLERVVAEKGASTTAELRLAVARSGTGDREGAIALLRSLDERYPGHPDIAYDLAVVLGPGEEALGLLDRATRLRLPFEAAWIYKGRFLAMLGRNAEAEEALMRALAIEPASDRARRELQSLRSAAREPDPGLESSLQPKP